MLTPQRLVAYIDLVWRWFRGREVRLAVEFDGAPRTGRTALSWLIGGGEIGSSRLAGGLLEITMTHVTREYNRTGALMATTLYTRWHEAG